MIDRFLLRHKLLGKSNKKDYDKSRKNLPLIFLHEKIDKKSYKMDIYKIAKRVYNKNPDKTPIRVGYLFLHSLLVFREISIL